VGSEQLIEGGKGKARIFLPKRETNLDLITGSQEKEPIGLEKARFKIESPQGGALFFVLCL